MTDLTKMTVEELREYAIDAGGYTWVNVFFELARRLEELKAENERLRAALDGVYL